MEVFVQGANEEMIEVRGYRLTETEETEDLMPRGY